MKKHPVFLIGFLFLCGVPLLAAELLQGDEQSFETGITPGRWTLFTWPDNRTEVGNNPSPLGNIGSEGSGGGDMIVVSVNDAASGFGSKCLGIYDTDSDMVWPDTGGVMITLDVLSGATYTVSAQIKFATDTSGYHAAGGISIDTDGGTDPLAAEYGRAGAGGGVDQNEFDPIRAVSQSDPAYLLGEWAWNESWVGGGGIEGTWYGPPTDDFKRDIASTGGQMTIFLWGITKHNSNMVLFDGISVDGPPPPTPTATRTPSTGVKEWNVYR
jgi:hypothetical protein